MPLPATGSAMRGFDKPTVPRGIIKGHQTESSKACLETRAVTPPRGAGWVELGRVGVELGRVGVGAVWGGGGAVAGCVGVMRGGRVCA